MRSRVARSVAVGASMAVLGCSHEIHHPTQEEVLALGTPVAQLRMPPTADSDYGRSALDAGVGASAAAIVGSFDGPGPTQFGRVVDARRVTDRLVVADEYSRELRVFTLDGLPLYVLGGPGSGPGEFLVPRGIDIDVAGRLVSFDGRGSVTAYSQLDQAAAPDLQFTFPGEIGDGCAMDGAYYIHGLTSAGMETLHRYDTTGDRLNSFGDIYHSANRVVLQQVALGKILCHRGRHEILLLPGMLPQLRAYGPTGVLRWWVSIQGLDNPDVVEVPRGARVRLPCSGYDSVETLVEVPGGTLVQIAHAKPGCPGVSHEVALHSFVLSGTPPSPRYLGTTLPAVFYADSLYTVVFERDPFPRLALVRTPSLFD